MREKRICTYAGVLCATIVSLGTVTMAIGEETLMKVKASARNAPKKEKSTMPDAVMNPRIELSNPVTVALAPPKVQGWGPWQFPVLSRLRDGRILISWHVEADSVTAYGLPPAYAVSADEGKTWTILPREGEALRQVLALRRGTRLPNGDLLLGAGRPRSRKAAELKLPEKPFARFTVYKRTISVYRLADLPPECAAGWKLLRLPAGQSEWREEQAAVRLPGEIRSVTHDMMAFPGFGFEYGSCDTMIVAPDGALLAEGFYGRRVVDGNLQQKTVAFMLRSTDNGKTWDLWSEIPYAGDAAADPQADKRFGFGEPRSIFMPDGSMLCLMRTTDGNGPGPLYWSRSTDGGKTWSRPAVFDDLGVWPQLLTLKNGVTLAVYGRPGLYIRATADPAGLRWEKRVTVVAPGTINRDTCSYAALLPLSDNTALMAYSDFNLPNANGKSCKGIQVRKVTVPK